MDKIPKIYTADEVAKLLRISRRTVNNYVKGGQLQSLHMGKYLRFTEDQILDFLSQGKASGLFVRGAAPSFMDGEAESTAAPTPAPEPTPDRATAAELAGSAACEQPQWPPQWPEDGTFEERSAALRAVASKMRETDPDQAEAVLREIEDMASLLPWMDDLDRAEDEGSSAEIQRIKRTVRDMLIRQYEEGEKLGGRLGELVRSLRMSRPERFRPRPKTGAKGRPRGRREK